MLACYLRVSTHDQNLEPQKAALTRWLEANGHDPSLVRWYEDIASGANHDRPSFERMQADLFAGEITSVVVYKLDRLSRNLRDGVNLLCDWIDRGIRIVAVTQQLDFSGTTGKLFGLLLVGIADMERDFIRERQATGIAKAKEKGKYAGRRQGALKRMGDGNDSSFDPIAKTAELWNNGNMMVDVSRLVGVTPKTARKYRRMADQRGLITRPIPN